MENKEGGVFSPCSNLDSASMIKCQQALLCEYPSMKFSSVTADKKYGGFRVFFWEPEESTVLEKNQVSTDGHYVYIYPLTAHLIALNLDHKRITPLFERELRDAVQKKFGRVINIDKTSNADQSKNWCIEIDIPEYIDLEHNERRMYSDMILRNLGRHGELALKHWCRQCKMSGHFQHECLSRLEQEETDEGRYTINDENPRSNGQFGENFNGPVNSQSDQNTERTPKKIHLIATESYAEEIEREEVMSFSKEKEKRVLDNNTSLGKSGNINSNLVREKDIKKEVVEDTQNLDTKQDKNLEIKNEEIPENNNRIKRTENENASNKSGNTFSNDDDDIEFIGDTFEGATSPSYASNSSARAEGRNLDEQSRSSPETKNVNFTSSFSSVAASSYESPSAPPKTPRGAEVTTALSERLQECINQVCDDKRVLDRKQLDAFLIHVKKKSNPIRVALNYTPNTKGLKEQLQAILHMYYNTPQTGTKEDIQFIKWLNGLVDRYDGAIPKKRKRSGKTDDDGPAAKR